MHTYNVKGRWYESSKYIYLCICEYLVWVIISSSLGIRSFTWLVWLMSVENFIRRVQQLLLQDNNSCLMFSYTCNWFSFLNFKCISISIISTQIYIHMLRSLEYYASRKPILFRHTLESLLCDPPPLTVLSTVQCSDVLGTATLRPTVCYKLDVS